MSHRERLSCLQKHLEDKPTCSRTDPNFLIICSNAVLHLTRRIALSPALVHPCTRPALTEKADEHGYKKRLSNQLLTGQEVGGALVPEVLRPLEVSEIMIVSS